VGLLLHQIVTAADERRMAISSSANLNHPPDPRLYEIDGVTLASRGSLCLSHRRPWRACYANRDVNQTETDGRHR